MKDDNLMDSIVILMKEVNDLKRQVEDLKSKKVISQRGLKFHVTKDGITHGFYQVKEIADFYRISQSMVYKILKGTKSRLGKQFNIIVNYKEKTNSEIDDINKPPVIKEANANT